MSQPVVVALPGAKTDKALRCEQKALNYEKKGNLAKAQRNREKAYRIREKNGIAHPVGTIPPAQLYNNQMNNAGLQPTI